MDTNENSPLTDPLERFLAGVATPEEEEMIQLKMEEDPAFKIQINHILKQHEATEKLLYRAHIRKLLEEVDEASSLQRKKQNIIIGGWSSMLAACAVFILYLTYAPLSLPTQTIEATTVRGNSNFLNDESDTDQQKKQIFTLFFDAQSYLAEGENQEAILKLEQLAQVKGMRTYFNEAVHWNLIVAYIQNDNLARASGLYEELGKPKEYEIKTIERWKVWCRLKFHSLTGR